MIWNAKFHLVNEVLESDSLLRVQFDWKNDTKIQSYKKPADFWCCAQRLSCRPTFLQQSCVYAGKPQIPPCSVSLDWLAELHQKKSDFIFMSINEHVITSDHYVET